MTVPATADALTPAWIGNQLRSRGVVATADPLVAAERIGTGLVGQSFRLSLTWPDGVDAVIANVPEYWLLAPALRLTAIGSPLFGVRLRNGVVSKGSLTVSVTFTKVWPKRPVARS